MTLSEMADHIEIDPRECEDNAYCDNRTCRLVGSFTLSTPFNFFIIQFELARKILDAAHRLNKVIMASFTLDVVECLADQVWSETSARVEKIHKNGVLNFSRLPQTHLLDGTCWKND